MRKKLLELVEKLRNNDFDKLADQVDDVAEFGYREEVEGLVNLLKL